ncbi:spore coat protein CotJB [Oscillospiraceae bacterium PP1C4]
MSEQQRLLKLIGACDFAITDVVLYLDSHPTCRNALAYYEKHRKMRSEAAAAYESQFGPLNMRSNENPNKWTWIDNPWPWEMEA